MNRNIYDDFYAKPYLVLAPGKVIEKLEPKDNELNRFKAGSDMTFTTWTISETKFAQQILVRRFPNRRAGRDD